MIRIAPVFFAGFFFAASMSVAVARDNVGEATCSGTERRDGTDQDGNKVNCLFDKCTQLQCDTSGSEITNCVSITSYKNARDCKAAARGGGAGITPGTINPGVLDPGNPPPRRLPLEVAPRGGAVQQ